MTAHRSILAAYAYRADLAAESLRGRWSRRRAMRRARRARSCIPRRRCGRSPNPRSSWTTEALFGELVTVYDEKDGWAWVQLARDGYVGYVRPGALSAQVKPPTHRVRALGTFLYPAAEVKAPPWLHAQHDSRC